MLASVWRSVVAFCSSLGALLLLVTMLPPRWYIAALSEAWLQPREGILIVLGGDVLDTGMLGETSYWRSVFAVQAWREGHFRALILSGHIFTTAPMRDFIVSQGVPAGVVLMEGRSTNTRENAVFTAEMVRSMSGPFVLLTSDYHMWRARRAFAKAGVTVVPFPFSEARKRSEDWLSRWRVFLDLAQESAKIVYYRLRGWI